MLYPSILVKELYFKGKQMGKIKKYKSVRNKERVLPGSAPYACWKSHTRGPYAGLGIAKHVAFSVPLHSTF